MTRQDPEAAEDGPWGDTAAGFPLSPRFHGSVTSWGRVGAKPKSVHPAKGKVLLPLRDDTTGLGRGIVPLTVIGLHLARQATSSPHLPNLHLRIAMRLHGPSAPMRPLCSSAPTEQSLFYLGCQKPNRHHPLPSPPSLPAPSCGGGPVFYRHVTQWFSLLKGSRQHQGIRTRSAWDAVLGSGELGCPPTPKALPSPAHWLPLPGPGPAASV